MGNNMSILMNCPQIISYQPMQTSDFDEKLTFSPFLSRAYRETDIITILDSGNETE